VVNIIGFYLSGEQALFAPVKVVIRDRVSGKVLYSEGPYEREVAVLVAEEASRVVKVLGVQGYLDRERR
jgi:hypothetical protein